MAYGWDGLPFSIDVTGNKIPHEARERFYPYHYAFNFGD